ncbi:MAG: recombination mediator RecR [Chitinophagaceae bacterium]
MKFSSSLIEQAVLEFSKLPGVGKKTALRHVLHLLKTDQEKVNYFAEVIINMRNNIQYCNLCFNVSDSNECKICSDFSRKRNIICVVENIRDVMSIESTQHYSGLYHVLGALLSPIDGIGPEQLTIQSLIERAKTNDTTEIIFALSPTLEGDTTSYYIHKKLADMPIRFTTLSRGVAFGGELEYTDDLTLARSIMNRRPLEDMVK